MVEYKVDNLMFCSEKVFVHGCNAQGVMGSGVAASVRSVYPKMYQEYREHYENKGLSVGDIIPVRLREFSNLNINPIYGVNAITQEYYGRDKNKVYVSYEGIKEVFKKINDLFPIENYPDIAIPKIGAGLGGGDWDKIINIITDQLPNRKIVVYVLDAKEIPKK